MFSVANELIEPIIGGLVGGILGVIVERFFRTFYERRCVSRCLREIRMFAEQVSSCGNVRDAHVFLVGAQGLLARVRELPADRASVQISLGSVQTELLAICLELEQCDCLVGEDAVRRVTSLKSRSQSILDATAAWE